MVSSAMAIAPVTKAPRPNEAMRQQRAPAATKVFGIAELLERILLWATTPQLDGHRSHLEATSLTVWPMAESGLRGGKEVSLFELQKVNKTFCATIRASPRLKQLLYMSPSDAPFAIRPAYDPLLFVLEHLDELSGCILFEYNTDPPDGWGSKSFIDPETGRFTFTVELQDIFHCNSQGTHDGLPESRYECASERELHTLIAGAFEPSWWYAEAGWRKIRVCSLRSPKPITLRIIGDEDWEDQREAMIDIGVPEARWKLQGDETLEHIVNLLCELFRTIDKLRSKRRELETELDAVCEMRRKTYPGTWAFFDTIEEFEEEYDNYQQETRRILEEKEEEFRKALPWPLTATNGFAAATAGLGDCK